MKPATKDEMDLIKEWFNEHHKKFYYNAWVMLRERDDKHMMYRPIIYI